MTHSGSVSGSSAPENQKLLSDLATIVRTRRLEVPAIFLLELCKPLATVAHSAGVMASPLLNALFGIRGGGKLVSLLESRENIEALIVLLERGEAKAA